MHLQVSLCDRAIPLQNQFMICNLYIQTIRPLKVLTNDSPFDGAERNILIDSPFGWWACKLSSEWTWFTCSLLLFIVLTNTWWRPLLFYHFHIGIVAINKSIIYIYHCRNRHCQLQIIIYVSRLSLIAISNIASHCCDHHPIQPQLDTCTHWNDESTAKCECHCQILKSTPDICD